MAERPGLRFGRIAEEYERVRSGYPAALVERAIALAALRAGDTVVEIGCGTGKLTRLLAERGLRVEAVEPDPALIEVARRVMGDEGVRFHVGTFEQAELPEEAFPAAFAATSFHWIDPAVGWRKVASLLEPAGVFALLSHTGGLRGDLDQELLRVWHEIVPGSAERWKPVDDETLWHGTESRMGNVSELWSWLTHHDLTRPEASELFTDVQLAREPFELDLSTDEYLERLRTSNYYLHLARDLQQRLDDALRTVIEAHGGTYPRGATQSSSRPAGPASRARARTGTSAGRALRRPPAAISRASSISRSRARRAGPRRSRSSAPSSCRTVIRISCSSSPGSGNDSSSGSR